MARWIPRRRRIYDLSGFLRRLDGGCPVKMGASCGPAAPDFPDLPRPAGVGRTQPRCYAARDSADGRRLPRLPSSASGARWTPFFTGQPPSRLHNLQCDQNTYRRRKCTPGIQSADHLQPTTTPQSQALGRQVCCAPSDHAAQPERLGRQASRMFERHDCRTTGPTPRVREAPQTFRLQGEPGNAGPQGAARNTPDVPGPLRTHDGQSHANDRSSRLPAPFLHKPHQMHYSFIFIAATPSKTAIRSLAPFTASAPPVTECQISRK